MKYLCVYCAGGPGREIAEVAQAINRIACRWNDIIFIDDGDVPDVINGRRVLNYDTAINEIGLDKCEFIIMSGEPVIRRKLFDKVEKDNGNIVNFFSNKDNISELSSWGRGNVVHKGAIVTCNCNIANNVYINKNVIIGHDVVIGNHCVISPGAVIGGDVVIADNVYIGSGAIIRNGIKIGVNCIVGMGSVVTKSVEPSSIIVGNPAKLMRKNTSGRVFKTGK